MRVASITETKARLSALIDLVRRGETVTILDRGRPVARLVPIPPAKDDDAARLDRLEAAGIIRRGRGGPPSELILSPPPKVSGVLEALLEERREGR